MRVHLVAALAVFASALTCGVTFLFALYRQFALVEVAACMVLGVELYFLSSTIGDWIEKKSQPSGSRKWIAMGLAAAVVGYFLTMKMLYGSARG